MDIRAFFQTRTAEIMAATSGLAVQAIAGVISGWSIGWIVLAGSATAAAFVWLYHGWQRVHGFRFRPVNQDKWARVDLLAEWQAACIYEDIEPYVPLRGGTPCYAALQMLKSARMRGYLTPSEQAKDDGWIRYERGELRRYAESRGDCPKALFPERYNA